MVDDAIDVRRTLELLWGVERRLRPGPKPRLEVREIVDAAIAYADRAGLAALTMRRLAGELDLGTATLYTYVPGREALTALMVDKVAGASSPPHTLPGDWRARLEAWAREDWALYHRHPWVLEVALSRLLPGPQLLAWYDSALRALAGTGLPDQEKVAVIETVDGYVRGAARTSVGRDTGPRGDDHTQQVYAAMAELFDPRQFPELARALAAGVDLLTGHTFDRGLGYVLDGVALRIGLSAPRVK